MVYQTSLEQSSLSERHKVCCSPFFGKLINNSAQQKKKREKNFHPHSCSFTFLLSALVSPQGNGTDRWWEKNKEQEGLISIFGSCFKDTPRTFGRSKPDMLSTFPRIRCLWVHKYSHSICHQQAYFGLNYQLPVSG